MKVKVGDHVIGGQIFATVPETPLIEHRCMIPPTLEGEVIETVSNGQYNILTCIAKVADAQGEVHELTLCQKWPIKTARPVKQRLPISVPLITGQRILIPISNRQRRNSRNSRRFRYRKNDDTASIGQNGVMRISLCMSAVENVVMR